MPKDSSYLDTRGVRESVYLLLYARDACGLGSGHFGTPYVRGEMTRALLGEHFQERVRDDSARVNADGVDASGVQQDDVSIEALADGLAQVEVTGTFDTAIRRLGQRLSECSLEDEETPALAACSASQPAPNVNSFLKRAKRSSPPIQSPNVTRQRAEGFDSDDGPDGDPFGFGFHVD